MRWIEAQFPVSTLPVFLPLLVVLLTANALLWRYIFTRGRRG